MQTKLFHQIDNKYHNRYLYKESENNNFANNLTFKGVREDIIEGEKAVKEVRRLGLQSSSKNLFKLLWEPKDKHSPQYFVLLNNIFQKLNQKMNEVYKTRRDRRFIESNYVKLLKEVALEYKTANCGELSLFAQELLKNKGINTKLIRCDFNKDGTKANHSFLLAGLSKDAQIDKPKTWGKDAIMIDPWNDFVGRANQGLIMLQDSFNIKNKKEGISFSLI